MAQKDLPVLPLTPDLWVRLRQRLGTLTPATLGVYLLTLYVGAASLYNVVASIQYRFASSGLLFGGDSADPLYELGTSLGFWGTIYFCLNFVLATRWFWVERLFGGMDKVYQLHGWVGKLTLTLVVLHLAILVVQALPDRDLVATYLLPGVDLGYTLGLAGVLLLTLLIVVTLWVKLAYHVWLATHPWLGVAYVLGGLHAVVLQGDWYMILLTAVGGYAWLYSLLLFRRTGPRYGGTLVHNRRKGTVNELVIGLDRAMPVRPGQFVWIGVEQSAAPIARELHPFSVSQVVDDRTIRISAKTLGDYTATLRDLAPQDRLGVYGPYGAFGAKYLTAPQAMVWIAGGIGITPFLSMLHAEAESPRDRTVTLVWTVNRAEDAVYHDEIEQICRSAPHIRYHLHVSATAGRLDVARLTDLVGQELLARGRVFLCGPVGMMQALTAALARLGKDPREVVAEEFVLR